MRITLNLNLFFKDHRSLAKIHINERMKTIEDVQHRISKIFQIENFYLNCDNQFLPPSEDVQILNNDDVVWVLPYGENEKRPTNEVVTKTATNTEQVQVITCKEEKKKKRKHREETVEETPLPPLTNKKEHEEQNLPPSPTKKKKHKNIKEKLKHQNEEIFKDSGRDSLDSSKNGDLESGNTPVSVKTLVHTFENKKIVFNKQLEEYTPPSDKKKINIIKTIIVSNNKTPDSSIADISNLDDTPNVTQNGNNLIENGLAKRRRVRKRKRVKKIANTKGDTDVNENPVYHLIPSPLLKTCNPKHVRFNNENTVGVNGDAQTSELSKYPQNETTGETKKDEIVTVKIKKEEKDETITVDSIRDKQTFDGMKDNNGISEEFILKQPVTQNIQPRAGDLVAFKILRISENYTPEISSRIVGKVSNYIQEKNEVIFDIIYGQDQCVQPQGKFALETEEMDHSLNMFQCAWSDLLEPRLLFP